MTISRPSVDAPLAGHFGKAKWLLVYEAPERFELIQNVGLNGHYVAQAFAAHGCTDVVVRHLGPGAYSHVNAAGMRIWRGEDGRSARSLAEALQRNELLPLAESEVGHGRHGEHGHDHRGGDGHDHGGGCC